MPNQRIESAINLSIQQATGTVPDDDSIGVPILNWMSRSMDDVPPWWSFGRDAYLRKFWKDASHLSTIMYTAQTILTGVPLRIEARDPSITSHVERAEFLTDVLMTASEFGETLYAAKRRFVEDHLGTDNGGFLEVIGDGAPDGPIIGLPLAVRHLDSAYCWRTSNPEFPVVYHDPITGRAYKLHRTRVIAMSQMTSPIAGMNGVGFSAVSRSIQFAKHLQDIYIHKQEKLGSRPISVILVGAGFKGGQIMKAVRVAQVAMDNQGLRRYARTVAIGSENPDATIKPLVLNNFDPFDEEVAVNLAMYGLAAAFGIPIQEVWPTSGAKSGRGGDHQESRQRGKLPADFNAELELQFGQKYLPPYLKAVHDYRDDYQDERRALNQDIRARNRERNIGSGAITVRTARMDMVESGDMSREQFRMEELVEGRLENGNPTYILFYSGDKLTDEILDLGVDMPTDVYSNDPAAMLEKISMNKTLAYMALAEQTSQRNRLKILSALSALQALEHEYRGAELVSRFDSNSEDEEDGDDGQPPAAGEQASEQAGEQPADERENEEEEMDKPRDPPQARDARRMDIPKSEENARGPW